MKVTVKKLHGKECIVDISPTETVLQLKQKVSNILGIEAPQQQLLLIGKTLADERPLSFYPGIKDGSKLNLVIKESGEGSKETSTSNYGPGITMFKSELARVLRRYYTEANTKLLVDRMIGHFIVAVNEFSYDDLERLATTLMEEEEDNIA